MHIAFQPTPKAEVFSVRALPYVVWVSQEQKQDAHVAE
jgi:hypothetical protein